jgi:pyruvyltransferase
LFYHPKDITKKWKLGVIPHYIDKLSKAVLEFEKHGGVRILDIETDNIEGFIDEILQCDAIISSSLHGVIVAETYGIPAGWLRLSDKLMGGRFKFEDYFESTGRHGIEPLELDIMNIDVDEILASLPNKTVMFDRKKLLDSCPFLVAE